MLEASLDRATAALAGTDAGRDSRQAAMIRARRAAGPFEPRSVAEMRVILGTTVVLAGIAVVLFILG